MNNIEYYHGENITLIELYGAESEKFLQGMITADISALSERQLCPAALLNPQGKVIFDFLITRYNNSFYIDINSLYKEAFIQRLSMYKLRSDVTLVEHSGQHIIVNNIEGVGFVDTRFTTLNIQRVYRHFTSVYDEHNSRCFNAKNFEQLRIKHTIAKMGVDFMPGTIYPHNINYDLIDGISFTKGCYIGQEVVARMQHRTNIKKRLVTITGQENLNQAEQLFADGRLAGTLGSCYQTSALAIVRLDYIESSTNLVVNNKPVTIHKPDQFS